MNLSQELDEAMFCKIIYVSRVWFPARVPCARSAQSAQNCTFHVRLARAFIGREDPEIDPQEYINAYCSYYEKRIKVCMENLELYQSPGTKCINKLNLPFPATNNLT